MRFKHWKPLVLIIVFLLAIFAIILIPSEARADPVSGISPSFSPDETFHIAIGDVTPGSIISWGWDSDDTLDFWVKLPDGSTITGLPWAYGIKAQQSGTYELWWKNNNWFFSATVSYYAFSFYPQIHLVTPEDGSTITNKNQQITGTCDLFASKIRVSTNNVTFAEADKTDINWMYNASLISGANTIYVEASYQTGYNKILTHVEEFKLNLDTTWLYQENGATKIGIGIYAIIILVIILVPLAGLMLWKRSKKTE